jgi:predicted helicase
MLNLKPTHKVIQSYYHELQTLRILGQVHEGAVAPLFASILRHGAAQVPHLEFVEQYQLKRDGKKPLRADGALVDRQTQILVYGVWEAKDIKDNLTKEVAKKFKDGYPKENILFQTPHQLQLYRHGELIYEADISQSPAKLIEGIERFFDYQPPAYQQWEEAIVKFKERVGELGKTLVGIITKELQTNKPFKEAFETFRKLCRHSINPNLADAAILEMLVQHLLTERLFRTVCNNPDFREKNVIAKEIETVIAKLTAKSFSRDAFLKSLDHFYLAIERAAATIDEYSRKQEFLNVVYEKFFQGFAVKVADTHGIVYTPQPIVEFMVKSVEEILQQEFNRSLSSPGVQILDPFVGTGNFIMRVLREINPLALEQKYREELHCNEVMLLPYYIASMNIEQAFYKRTGEYVPFEGICLVDTFELVEEKQHELFVPANTQRVFRQKDAPIFVILGNPPYNVGQQNENDNNKNRKYPALEKLVAESYAADSTATNKNALSDAYVKAFQWATWCLQGVEEGIVAFVTNNSFLDSIAFDGMRKHLGQDFSKVYILDLKGNVRKDSMRDGIPIGEAHTIFGLAAMVGISVTFLVKTGTLAETKIFYSEVDWKAKRLDKFELIAQAGTYSKLPHRQIIPDKNHTWLTEGLHANFESFTPLGTKAEKASKQEVEGVIFKIYSNGVKTNRDTWAYHFNREILATNMQRTIEFYNQEVFRWSRRGDKPVRVDDFVVYDDTKLSWGESLKANLKRGKFAEYQEEKLRQSLYRPFTKMNLFFDRMFNERVYVFPSIFPIPSTENENRVICVPGNGSAQIAFFMGSVIMDLNFFAGSTPIQCFPFYTYAEDGTNRQENITDWTLKTFRTHYRSRKLTKWDIFYYVYGLLHHSGYRGKYAANLKRELPRLPYAPDFWTFAKAGQQLAELHLHYETQAEYPLRLVTKEPLNWRVEKMKLSKDKTSLIYNDTLAFTGIPPETFEYRLGNRSALEWVIDQYQVCQDKRSGIVNDPNRLEEEQYIVRLIGQVITVSLKTVAIVKELPEIE